MLEATDGLCYYPPDEDWGWFNPYQDNDDDGKG
jgi:uncharacterized protein (DUF1684 family)